MNLIEENLTNREQEVYRYLLQGMSYNDMAREMVVEKTTVMTYIMHLFLKKEVNSRYELMAKRIKELENKIKELKGANCVTRVS